MSDSLSYRIPGEESISKEGVFLPIDSLTDFEGFVVSNFEGTNFYGFVESKVEESKAFAKNDLVPFVISKEKYLIDAELFLSKMLENNIDKAIFSRVKECKFDGIPNDLFHALLIKYPKAFCYSIKSESLGTWVGASPEKLIEICGDQGTTIALASTKPSADNSAWGEKELSEQQLVADFIESTLEKNASSIKKSDRAESVAGPVKHLITHFSFECSRGNFKNLLKDLHPTPAVSGFPRDKAMALIKESENHSREIYAGIIGLISKHSAQLFVNLRSCKILKDSAYLFLGGGYTKDSIPADEWIETENKALTILSVLQNI